MDPADQPTHPRIRTYAGSRGRLSPVTRERMDELLPQRSVPDGVLDPEVAFGRRGPVVVEVGSGHGNAARAYAQTHPEHDIVAIDVHVPGVARMLLAADGEGLTNLWAHRGDGVAFLHDRVAPDSLEAVHLFFPDPWNKNKHHKRRFVSHENLDLVASRLRPGGRLLFATDHAGYAEHALAVFGERTDLDVVVGERPDWRPRIGFEQKGIDAGRSVTEVRATKPVG